MGLREDRAPVWAIWLLIAFGAVQPLIWTHVSTAVQRRAVFLPIPGSFASSEARASMADTLEWQLERKAHASRELGHFLLRQIRRFLLCVTECNQ